MATLANLIVNRTDTFDEWRIKTNRMGAAFGDIDTLVTTADGDLVSAINEVKQALVSFASTNIVQGDGLLATVNNGVVTLSNSDKGSSQRMFKTISVSGQPTVVANNNESTLTLVAGSNIAITTDATTDTITITGTAPVRDSLITINTGVQGTTGLSGGGSFTLNQTGAATFNLVNEDKGSSQFIFKIITVEGQPTITANSNNDTIKFVAGRPGVTNGIDISSVSATKVITIAHADTSTVLDITPVTGTYVKSLGFDTYGHVTSYSVDQVVSANNGTLTLNVNGVGLSGSTSFSANQAGNATFTVTSNATNANNVNTIVARDGSGNFSAGSITLGGILSQLYSGDHYNTIGAGDSNRLNYGWTGTTSGFAFIGTQQRNNVLNIEGSSIRFNTTAGNDQLQINADGRTLIGVGAVDQTTTVTIGGAQGTLYVKGATTLAGGVTVTGVISGGSLSVSGAVSGGSVSTGGAISGGSLGISGAAALSGGVTGGLAVTGALSATSGLTITGAITATGDITAGYSDDRLKDRFENIPNALNKVLQLNGFYYTPNKIAQELGAVNNGQEVGVSAQEVLSVLPEVVKDAPIDTSYMTVDYSKMVPLLIEAIKGLNAKVESLEAKLKK